jgi:hypothetical protein
MKSERSPSCPDYLVSLSSRQSSEDIQSCNDIGESQVKPTITNYSRLANYRTWIIARWGDSLVIRSITDFSMPGTTSGGSSMIVNQRVK